MDKMTIAMSNNFHRQSPNDRMIPHRPIPPPPKKTPYRAPDNIPPVCWKCKQPGHKAYDCPNDKPVSYAQMNLLETVQCNHVERELSTDDRTPSTREAQIYAAAEARTRPLQRTPRNRVAFTPEGIQAARDARANRGNTAASGSGAAPTPAVNPRAAPTGRGPPQSAPANNYPAQQPQRFQRGPNNGRAIDSMAQLDNTPMKISFGICQGGSRLLCRAN